MKGNICVLSLNHYSTLPYKDLPTFVVCDEIFIFQSVAEVAEDVWDRYDHEFGTDYSGLFKALSHVNYNIRTAAADALAAVLDEYPDTLQVITVC